MLNLQFKMKRSIYVCFLICLLSSVFCYADNLKIHFIDVGEGEATLIQTPAGKNVLVDTGNVITGVKVVQYLLANDAYELDYLILTHPHLDHMGGAFFVLQMMEVKNIFDNGEDLSDISQSNDMYRWYEQFVRSRNNYSVLQASDSFIVDEVLFDVLWPFGATYLANFNTNSIVVMVKYKEFKSILMADADISVEEGLLEIENDLDVNLIKVGHHGANDASSQAFLSKVSPEISVISIDEENIRGYPSSKVLERLEEAGSKIYTTYKDGTIIVEVGENGEFVIGTNM